MTIKATLCEWAFNHAYSFIGLQNLAVLLLKIQYFEPDNFSMQDIEREDQVWEEY
jgi:hypothetical protein